MKSFFDDKSVVPVRLREWMAYSSGQSDAALRVMLPMIQRGSVWKPHKVADLWDTLLRGMPIGAMMASESLVGDKVVAIGGNRDTNKAQAGDISLIDGQQRTLAMLAGWPQGLTNPLRAVAIWLDLNDEAQGEYKFRLWVSTKAQPFGYARASMGGQALSKLDRNKLRLANEAWGNHDVQTLWTQPGFMPWDAKFALPMTELIANKDELQAFIMQRRDEHEKALKERVAKTDTNDELHKFFSKRLDALPTEDDLNKFIPVLRAALASVMDYEYPVIHVRQELFDDEASNSPDTNIDPPLAILFKRIGTGGEPLSNGDYVYSIIKHHANDVHDTVETLLRDERIRAIYTPTSLVMSAVRLTMLSLKTEDSKGQKITDSAKLDKAAFARLVRNNRDFIRLFKEAIQLGGWFETCLKKVLDNLNYNSDNFCTGLPKHALCLIPIPLLETILAWHMLRAPSDENMSKSRLPMVRFILQGNLCILDYAKASEVSIKELSVGGDLADSNIFPDQALMGILSQGEKPTAYPLPSPDALRNIKNSKGLLITESADEVNGLRGWTRFSLEQGADLHDKQQTEVYKRWWNRNRGHIHPMLLWLQRDYVFRKFEKDPALAGMDEETPYDFDHILPSAHWADWRGKGKDKFSDYPLKNGDKVIDDSGYLHIGNSIGNIHVLKSEENRSLGEASASKKLETSDFMENDVIHDDKYFWNKASGSENESRIWKIDRALAFQRAVEQRTFALYTKFYKDLFSGSENGC